MGTSTNQRSPRTSNWKAVETAYTHPGTTIQRTAQEIWRAASNEPDGGLVRTLSSPGIAQCLEAVQTSRSGTDAAQQVRRLLALSGQASLAGEIAQRAAVIAHGIKDDRTSAFVRSLFSEASNYLVSRDLPGFVGLADKVRTVQNATAFKSSIIQEVSNKVDAVPKPSGRLSSPKTWQKYVNNIVDHLTGAK
jgi:hypothetical protein